MTTFNYVELALFALFFIWMITGRIVESITINGLREESSRYENALQRILQICRDANHNQALRAAIRQRAIRLGSNPC